MTNQSHGHVTPNADGYLARCGGPSICAHCQFELAQLRAKSAPAEPSREAVAWMVSGGDSRAKSYDTYPVWAAGDSDLIITTLYTAPPSPDAELVELLKEVRKAYRRGPLEIWDRIDAKLASLRT